MSKHYIFESKLSLFRKYLTMSTTLKLVGILFENLAAELRVVKGLLTYLILREYSVELR